MGGVSIFGFGASWKAPELERDVVRGVITFLEDKRALYVPHDVEILDYVDQSLLQIREELTKNISKLKDKSPAIESLRIMRAACRTYLTTSGGENGRHHHRHHFGERDSAFIELGKLRAIFGQQVAVLGYLYGVDIEEGLASILPPLPDAKD